MLWIVSIFQWDFFYGGNKLDNGIGLVNNWIFVTSLLTSNLREGLPKKSSCYFGFCPNYLNPPPPPPPNLDNLYHFFNANVPKSLGKGLPLLPYPQIDPIYTVCEKWTKNLGRALPPPQLDKIQKNSYFFRETFPKRTLGANNFISSNILCKIFEPLNHHACNSIPNILGSSILNPFRCLKMSNGEFYNFWRWKKSYGDRRKV